MKLLDCISVVILSVIFVIAAGSHIQKIKKKTDNCLKYNPLFDTNCHVECLLEENKVLIDGKLSKPNLTHFIKEHFSIEEDQKLFDEILNQCDSERSEITEKCGIAQYLIDCLTERAKLKGVDVDQIFMAFF